MTSLPKMFFLPALVAGFVRLLILQSPGKVNWPTLLISLVAILARLLMTFEACLALISNSPAIALTRAPLVMGLAAFSFMAFMLFGGNILLSADERNEACRWLD